MRMRSVISMLMLIGWGLGACNSVPSGTGGGGLASQVNAKATQIAQHIGGSAGFGGMAMQGYYAHAQGGMSFADAQDLADADATMMVTIQNDSTQSCTVHLAYIASAVGLTDQTRDVEVAAGDEVTVEVPCAEMMGTGSLETPGASACQLADGETIDNRMSVPGFLGLDYQCGDGYRFMLTPDTDDLDGDGDTTELIMSSEALQLHLQNGGPSGHMHGAGEGMMGSHWGL